MWCWVGASCPDVTFKLDIYDLVGTLVVVSGRVAELSLSHKLFTSRRYAQASPAGRVTVQQLVRNAQLLHSVTVW